MTTREHSCYRWLFILVFSSTILPVFSATTSDNSFVWTLHQVEQISTASEFVVAFCTGVPNVDLGVVDDGHGTRCTVRTASFRVISAMNPRIVGTEIHVGYHHITSYSGENWGCPHWMNHPVFRPASFPIVSTESPDARSPFTTGYSPIRFQTDEREASAPLYWLALDSQTNLLFEPPVPDGGPPGAKQAVSRPLPEDCFRYVTGALMLCNGRPSVPPRPELEGLAFAEAWVENALRNRDPEALETILWGNVDAWRLHLADHDESIARAIHPEFIRVMRRYAINEMTNVPELLPLLCRYFYDNIPPDQVPQEDEWQRNRLGRILRSLSVAPGEGASVRVEWSEPVGDRATVSFRAEEREIGQIAVEKRRLPGDRFVWLPAPDPFFAP